MISEPNLRGWVPISWLSKKGKTEGREIAKTMVMQKECDSFRAFQNVLMAEWDLGGPRFGPQLCHLCDQLCDAGQVSYLPESQYTKDIKVSHRRFLRICEKVLCRIRHKR